MNEPVVISLLHFVGYDGVPGEKGTSGVNGLSGRPGRPGDRGSDGIGGEVRFYLRDTIIHINDKRFSFEISLTHQ
jgi:hypothetical protein